MVTEFLTVDKTNHHGKVKLFDFRFLSKWVKDCYTNIMED